MKKIRGITVRFDITSRTEHLGFCEEYSLNIRFNNPVTSEEDCITIKQYNKEGYHSFMKRAHEMVKDTKTITKLIENKLNDSRVIMNRKSLEREINNIAYTVSVEI